MSGGKGVVFRGEEGEFPGKREEEVGICRDVGKARGGPQGAPAQPEPAAGGRRARPEGGLPCGPDPGFCTGWRRGWAGQKRFRDEKTFCCVIKWGRISGSAGIVAERRGGLSYVPYKIGKLQIQGFSEPITSKKIKQSYHITQKAARSRPRAAFLRGKLGRRQKFSKK